MQLQPTQTQQTAVGGACVLVPGVPQRLVMAQYYSDAYLTVAASGHEGADLQISAVSTYLSLIHI